MRRNGRETRRSGHLPDDDQTSQFDSKRSLPRTAARDLFGGLIYSIPERAEAKNASGDSCWGHRHSHSRDRGVGVRSRCRKCD